MGNVQNRDVIVIGSSLGGIEALSTLAATLPADLQASVFVVQHIAADSPGILSDILNRVGPLPAVTARDGMEILRGHFYVAPPDRHLVLGESGIRVVFGPRENRTRPAIDPLFRTAAVNFRSRVIGVVLTGLLGDGAAGLLAIHRCGGVAIVQTPDDAEYPQMPGSALAAVRDALQAPLSELGPLLAHLSAQPAPRAPPVPELLQIEARLTERAMTSEDWDNVPAQSTDFTCPECGGSIREIEDNGLRRYRCRVGHAYGAEDLEAAKGADLEETLWAALQTLQERAQMLETMARDDRGRGWDRSAADYEGKAREVRDHADRLRVFIAELIG